MDLNALNSWAEGELIKIRAKKFPYFDAEKTAEERQKDPGMEVHMPHIINYFEMVIKRIQLVDEHAVKRDKSMKDIEEHLKQLKNRGVKLPWEQKKEEQKETVSADAPEQPLIPED